MRAPLLRIHADELIVDGFAGGGGTSLGIEWALGRSPDIALNHDAQALAMHEANHPNTRHLLGNIWDVRPYDVTKGRDVGLAWFSPDCKHFSKAKGAKPVSKKIRGLAGVVVRWARAVRPRVIALENVEEFQTWGPLDDENRPIRERAGEHFRRWLFDLRKLGYAVEWRELAAHHFGAPTIRKRLFVIARCDGRPIVWPDPTHGPGRTPYRSVAECIQWELECRSIFERARALVPNTLARIARGLRRFLLEAETPFIAPVGGRFASPSLVQTGYGERPGQAPRSLDLHEPLGTIVAGGCKHALVAAFLAQHFGDRPSGGWAGGRSLEGPAGTITVRDHHALVAASLLALRGSDRGGRDLGLPAPTITAGGTHLAEVRAFLTRYNGQGDGQRAGAPLGTITTKDRFGLVQVAGRDYEIADIGMRMLAPRELFRAQGFPDSYVIDPEVDGEPLNQTAQIRMVGNSVCPQLARVVVEANFERRVRSSRQLTLGVA